MLKAPNVERPSHGITKYPTTVEGWVKRINKMAIGHGDLELFRHLSESGMFNEVYEKFFAAKENIDFEEFWKLYGGGPGKIKCKSIWYRYTKGTQERILEGVVRYNRFIDLTGTYKKNPQTYLNSHDWATNNYPAQERISAWRNVLKRAVNDNASFKISRVYSAYREEEDTTIDVAVETLLYRYPHAKITDVLGIIRWMINDWKKEYTHLIKIKKALDDRDHHRYKEQARKHVEWVEKLMADRKIISRDLTEPEKRVFEVKEEEVRRDADKHKQALLWSDSEEE